jgi:hypothetical protein
MTESQVRSTRLLVFCGVAAPALYIAGDILMAMKDDGYNYLHQTISELNAVGAPTRGLSIAFGAAVYLLLIAFGIGVRQAAGEGGKLRLAGNLLVALGIFSLWAVPFASMDVRGAEQEPTHLVAGAFAVVLLVMIIGVTAAAYPGIWRRYSIGTLVVMLAFGAWTAMDGPRVAEGLPTPWIGVKERISVYSYQLWLMMLALFLVSKPKKRRR